MSHQVSFKKQKSLPPRTPPSKALPQLRSASPVPVTKHKTNKKRKSHEYWKQLPPSPSHSNDLKTKQIPLPIVMNNGNSNGSGDDNDGDDDGDDDNDDDNDESNLSDSSSLSSKNRQSIEIIQAVPFAYDSDTMAITSNTIHSNSKKNANSKSTTSKSCCVYAFSFKINKATTYI